MQAPHPIARARTPHVLPGRDGARPRAIVVHSNVGTLASTINWFAREESGKSTHYAVGLDGFVVQFVDEEDGACHCLTAPVPSRLLGDESAARATVGIEFEDGGDPHGVRRPDIQYELGAALIAAIAARWDIELDRAHVFGHRELGAETECPGNLDVDRLVARARVIHELRAAAQR